jgi:hypothetical protein
MKVAIVFTDIKDKLNETNVCRAIRTMVTYDLNVEIFIVTNDLQVKKSISKNCLLKLNTTVIPSIDKLPKDFLAVLRIGSDAEVSESFLFDKVCQLMSWKSEKVYKEVTII